MLTKSITKYQLLTGITAAISLGISGCGVISNGLETTSDTVQSVTDITGTTSGALSSDDSAQAFVHENFDTISRDAARGGGQSIAALATMLQINDSQQLAYWMQNNHSFLFTADNADETLVARIRLANNG